MDSDWTEATLPLVKRRREDAPWVPPEGKWLGQWRWSPKFSCWLRCYTHYNERRVRSLYVNGFWQIVSIGDSKEQGT